MGAGAVYEHRADPREIMSLFGCLLEQNLHFWRLLHVQQEAPSEGMHESALRVRYLRQDDDRLEDIRLFSWS